ncbi:MAG: aspartate kinase [Candidatus Aphodosoma sp.]
MNIYKFGGASVKNADGVRNLSKIIGRNNDRMVVVVSAMGKMTNALELVVNSFFNHKADLEQNVQAVIAFHETIIAGLFGNERQEIDAAISELYGLLRGILHHKPSLSYDYEYDRIVSFGELLSTTIVATYLNHIGRNVQWVDIRGCLITDANFRDANVNMELSRELCRTTFAEDKVYITQGFMAGTKTNQTTTLGREGSDYTAALLANLTDAQSVTIWKDVPGVMNADPKLYGDVQIIPVLSYKEAIELSYCGASVIHPKTVKPLQNKNIPLYVRSFVHPDEPGSVINNYTERLDLPPIYINKRNQVLLSLTPRDFSFVAEERLSQIFGVLASYKLKLSLIQTAAISFSLCVDYDAANFQTMVAELQEEYEVLYNTDVELITIRHYTREIVDRLVGERTVFVEQRNRLTARFVVPVID